MSRRLFWPLFVRSICLLPRDILGISYYVAIVEIVLGLSVAMRPKCSRMADLANIVSIRFLSPLKCFFQLSIMFILFK